jgi:hypothetical protein
MLKLFLYGLKQSQMSLNSIFIVVQHQCYVLPGMQVHGITRSSRTKHSETIFKQVGKPQARAQSTHTRYLHQKSSKSLPEERSLC